MKLVLGTASCLAILIAANGAQAAQRYAAPNGTGSEPCTQAAPCSLKNAVAKAKSNDEVIVTAGSYTTAEEIFTEGSISGVSIHGDPAGPMPTITGSKTPYTIAVTGSASTISYLDIANTAETGGALACAGGFTVDRVRATSTGDAGSGIQQLQECTVRDSLARATGKNSTALLAAGATTTGVARNVTAIATGPGSIAVRALYNEFIFSGSYTLDLRNSIASGVAADLVAAQVGMGPGDIIVSNSNFDLAKGEASAKVIDAGGNQTASPLFVDAANGDYREAAGSPTIDAGAANQLGPLDLAGNARVIGPAPDIGAFEFVPPPGELRSITFKPPAFRAANVGGAVISRRKKRRPPVGSTVTYNLSAPATVTFSFERAAKGRRVGGKCRKATKANRTKKKCTFYRPIKGGFSVTGTTALNNQFRFSGRVENKPLKPGTYKIVGRAGTTLKRGLFKIVR